MTDKSSRSGGFEIVVGEEPKTVLWLERLRDGRVAIGTRRETSAPSDAGEIYVLDASAYLDLAAWFAPAVLDAWSDAVRDRQAEPLRTAAELYGEGSVGAGRLAHEMLQQIPPELLARAMILLANSIGPEARNRLVNRLNATTSSSEEGALRRQLSDENEAFAYAVAAAALFDAIATGAADAEE